MLLNYLLTFILMVMGTDGPKLFSLTSNGAALPVQAAPGRLEGKWKLPRV